MWISGNPFIKRPSQPRHSGAHTMLFKLAELNCCVLNFFTCLYIVILLPAHFCLVSFGVPLAVFLSLTDCLSFCYEMTYIITNPRKTSDWVDFIRRKVSERKNWIRMDWVWPKTNSVTTEKETCKFFACSEFVHREIRLSRNSYFDGLPLSSSSADEYPVKTFSQQWQRW